MHFVHTYPVYIVHSISFVQNDPAFLTSRIYVVQYQPQPYRLRSLEYCDVLFLGEEESFHISFIRYEKWEGVCVTVFYPK